MIRSAETQQEDPRIIEPYYHYSFLIGRVEKGWRLASLYFFRRTSDDNKNNVLTLWCMSNCLQKTPPCMTCLWTIFQVYSRVFWRYHEITVSISVHLYILGNLEVCSMIRKTFEFEFICTSRRFLRSVLWGEVPSIFRKLVIVSITRTLHVRKRQPSWRAKIYVDVRTTIDMALFRIFVPTSDRAVLDTGARP
jgi:hypothetical protein